MWKDLYLQIFKAIATFYDCSKQGLDIIDFNWWNLFRLCLLGFVWLYWMLKKVNHVCATDFKTQHARKHVESVISKHTSAGACFILHIFVDLYCCKARSICSYVRTTSIINQQSVALVKRDLSCALRFNWLSVFLKRPQQTSEEIKICITSEVMPHLLISLLVKQISTPKIQPEILTAEQLLSKLRHWDPCIEQRLSDYCFQLNKT